MEFIDHFRRARRSFRGLLAAFDLTVRFGGYAHAAAESGPAVILIHGSELIAQALLTAYYPRPFQAVVSLSIWKKPILRALASRLGFLNLPRRNGGWLSWIRAALNVLQSGGRIALFVPSDFASSNKPAAEFGIAAMLCRLTGCAFVPVATDGCDRVLPPGCFLPRVRPLRMLIGKPIKPRVETAVSNRNRDWATMFRTDLSILQQRLLACPEGVPGEHCSIVQPLPKASQE
ncbi:MAG: hypothetical protein BWY66_01039 [bacterium ADurb.Bin374]|nr:MAG: hypothetical protein BWY66_01039 [bacterium ADurb.Bin374]